MAKRTIEISSGPTHLSVRRKQLLIQRDGQSTAQVPCEDIGFLIIDQPRTTISHAVLNEISKAGGVVLLCDQRHLPSSICLPLADHSQVVWRLHDQLAVSKPLEKKLWKQLVQEKIRGQAWVLGESATSRKLLDLANNVRSGDPTNIEAQAARAYWKSFLPDEVFRRDASADDLNAFLNYGYAIIRAALARSIVSSGLLPAIGLHHRNRSNPFCLADDLIEPLRPFVDDRARDLYIQGYRELTTEAKQGLLELLTLRIDATDGTGPLMVKIQRLVTSLVDCMQGKSKKLTVPRIADAKFESTNIATGHNTCSTIDHSHHVH